MALLPIVEIFSSLQGEGCNSGAAAVFVRLAGCRNACPFCDTRESWHTRGYPSLSEEEITARVRSFHIGNCVVTGGEPMLYNLDRLTSLLHEAGVDCWLETSGTKPLSGHWDWICFSPKKGTNPLSVYYERASELKVVVGPPQTCSGDYIFAESQYDKSVAAGNAGCRFLQPEWPATPESMRQIAAYIQKHPHWRLSLQTHKFLGIS